MGEEKNFRHYNENMCCSVIILDSHKRKVYISTCICINSYLPRASRLTIYNFTNTYSVNSQLKRKQLGVTGKKHVKHYPFIFDYCADVARVRDLKINTSRYTQTHFFHCIYYSASLLSPCFKKGSAEDVSVSCFATETGDKWALKCRDP